MSDDPREMAAKFFKEEYAKVETREAAREKERAFLKDKSIGGPGPVPRPSDGFIDKNLGKPMSRAAMTEEASRKATARLKAFQAQERKKEAQSLKQDAGKTQKKAAKAAFGESARNAKAPEKPDQKPEQKLSLVKRILQRQRSQAKGRTRKP